MRYQDYIGKEMEIVSKSFYIRGLIGSDGDPLLNKLANKKDNWYIDSGPWALSWRTNSLNINSSELEKEGYLVFIDRKLEPEMSSIEDIFELLTLLESLD